MTDRKIKIAGLGGSLEKKSTTLAALKFALNETEKSGAETVLYDIAKFDLPIYNPANALEIESESFKKFLNDIHSADGYIFASPEYHGSVSGAFKNVVDYLEYLSDYDPPYLTRKPVGCIAAGGGEISGVTTIQTMVNIVHNLRGISPSKNVAIVSAQKHFDENSVLQNDIVKKRLSRLASEVYILAQKLSR